MHDLLVVDRVTNVYTRTHTMCTVIMGSTLLRHAGSPILAGYGTTDTAGSRLTTYGALLQEWRYDVILWGTNTFPMSHTPYHPCV